MKQHKHSPTRLTLIRKTSSECNKEYAQYPIEQQSNKAQYLQLAVPSKGAEAVVQVYLGYRRCAEFDEGNQPGQDYAVVRVGDGYVIGIVADGVSRSFYGNLAAKSLSTWLVNQLWHQRAAPPDHDSMKRLLKEEEAKFAKSVEDHQIRTDLPVILLSALERKRLKGSQTVFAAFVLEVASSKLTLYQVGDVKALIHNSKPEPELVEAAAEGRWSSGGQSLLLLKQTLFENVDGLVIKSDGVSDDWGRTLEKSAFDEDQFSLMTELRSPLDDISFIAVRRDPLLPAAPSELPREISSEAESEATLPESPLLDSDLVSGSSAPVAVDQNHRTLPDRDVADVLEKKANAGKAAEQKEVASARHQRRHLKMFLAGAASGAALGAALTCLALFATGRLKTASVEGKQVAQQSNPDPASDKRSFVAPDGGNITVEVKETEQIEFQKEHATSFPPLISDNPTTKRGEVIAHVSTTNISVERVEFVLSDEEKSATERALNGDRTSFFVRLSGLTESKTVTIRLVDPQGNAIGEFHEKMRGREKRDPTNKDPFLGYHEISVKRAQ
jgi:hypothetical protein